MNKKSSFYGFTNVFNFTKNQAIKQKGFKTTTIIFSIIVVAIFSLINIIPAALNKDSDEGNQTSESVEVPSMDIYAVNNTELDFINFEDIKQYGQIDYEKVNIINSDKKEFNNDEVYIVFEKVNDEYYFRLHAVADTTDENTTSEEVYQKILDAFIRDFNVLKQTYANMTPEQYNAVVITPTTDVLEAGDKKESLGVELVKVFLPMLVTLLLYMLVLSNGQSITKSIMTERTSKLVETLILSVKPYALIAGKIIGIAYVAILQLVIWIAAGVGGYFIGSQIALSIDSEYTNYISMLFNVIKDAGGAEAFSAINVFCAIISLLIGFFVFCVIAAFAASFIKKLDDLSNATSIFQLPLVFGFMAAYFVPMIGNETAATVFRFIPLSAAFMLPSDFIISNASYVELLAALITMIVFGSILTIATGKIYKKKMFG